MEKKFLFIHVINMYKHKNQTYIRYIYIPVYLFLVSFSSVFAMLHYICFLLPFFYLQGVNAYTCTSFLTWKCQGGCHEGAPIITDCSTDL